MPRILLVHHDERLLASLQAILIAHGYSVEAVTTGIEALGQLAKEDVQYDCVITGLNLPELRRQPEGKHGDFHLPPPVCGGVVLIEKLRELGQIPIIVYTDAEIEDQLAAYRAGATDVRERLFVQPDQLLPHLREPLTPPPSPASIAAE